MGICGQSAACVGGFLVESSSFTRKRFFDALVARRLERRTKSEERFLEAIDATKDFFALPYGPSSVAPDDDVRAFELYFERLEAANLAKLKRPDLLIFPANVRKTIDKFVDSVGGLTELPFLPESQMQPLLDSALLAIECENSLWKARQMPDYNSPLKPQRRLDGKLGLKKAAVLPTVILKEEDRGALRGWQDENRVPIHIWHAFYDEAFGLSLDETDQLISSGRTEPTEQIFQAPGGAVSKKIIYKFLYHFAYRLGEAQTEPRLIADSITDKNGHILPFVRFSGGSLKLAESALQVLRAARTR